MGELINARSYADLQQLLPPKAATEERLRAEVVDIDRRLARIEDERAGRTTAAEGAEAGA